MKITAVAAVTIITATAARAGKTVQAADGVIVCTEISAGSGILQFQAQAIASKMFAAIGVSIHWRWGLDGCPPDGIQISLIAGSPRNAKPTEGALAYARPYEGVHIDILYDRIAQGTSTQLLPQLLAHVFAHEITHILQGSQHHSAQGIMKAQWNQDDLHSMLQKPLPFSSDDVRWIHQGLEARSARKYH